MVFKAKGAHTYKVRANLPDGRHSILTTGCRDEADAKDVEAVVRAWEGRKGRRQERLDVIEALLEKRFSLPAAIEAYRGGTLDALMSQHQAASPSVDMLPLIDAWRERKRKSKGGGQADTYHKQILTLYPERPVALSSFTRKEVWTRINALDVDTPTKNRYRTAASSLAKDLVAQDLLDRNFVRDIDGFGENDPRLVYYEVEDAKRLIRGMDQPYAAMSAAAFGFCMEWGALDAALAGDFNLKADPVVALVRGTKRVTRNRDVPLVPELAWTLDYIRPALRGKMAHVPAFDGVPEWRLLRIQRQTADRLKIKAVGEAEFGAHSIHDWRQTHGVALLRWGYSEQIVADHEGHKNTTMVRRKYGRFKSNRHDYAKKQAATKSTTSMRLHAKGGRAR